MKAFILAAGKGTRMSPLTAYNPKPLLTVAGKPIIQHTIDAIEDTVDEIIILVGWQSKRIKEKIRSDKVDITFARQEKPLGTAHAVSIAEKYVDGKFICVNGDVIIIDEAVDSFIDDFKKQEGSMMGLARVEDPRSYGVISVQDGLVKDIIEKPEVPPTDLVNAGFYGFTPDIFDAIDRTEKSTRGEYEITDSLRILMDEQELKGHEIVQEGWIELSRPWELLSANWNLLEKGSVKKMEKGEIEDGVHMEGWVSIGEGTKIKRGSYIQGPVCIGKNSDIGPNCLIRACTSIGDNCKVGNAVEVKNSIVMDGTNVPHHNYVGDSVLGMNCNLGSGSKVANLRLDEKNIIVTHRGKKVDTGRRKLGVIMGDNVKTGINSMMNTGTIIGEDSFIGPGSLADGEIGPKSRIQ
ncbi:MAG: sugar phosphate nucleotidyltransferase [Thermoplasmata archaeon]